MEATLSVPNPNSAIPNSAAIAMERAKAAEEAIRAKGGAEEGAKGGAEEEERAIPNSAAMAMERAIARAMERAKAAEEEEAKEVFGNTDDYIVKKISTQALECGQSIDEVLRATSDFLSSCNSDGFFKRMRDSMNELKQEKEDKGLDTRELEAFIEELKESEKLDYEGAQFVRAASIKVTNDVTQFARKVAEWNGTSRK